MLMKHTSMECSSKFDLNTGIHCIYLQRISNSLTPLNKCCVNPSDTKLPAAQIGAGALAYDKDLRAALGRTVLEPGSRW